MSQSRARGLTRAILDTFPVVKFGNATVGRDNVDSMGHFKDLESRLDSHGPRDSKIGEWEVMDAPLEMTVHGDGHEKRASIPNSGQGATEVDGNDAEVGQPQASGSRLSTATPPLAHNAEGSSASPNAPPKRTRSESIRRWAWRTATPPSQRSAGWPGRPSLLRWPDGPSTGSGRGGEIQDGMG